MRKLYAIIIMVSVSIGAQSQDCIIDNGNNQLFSPTSDIPAAQVGVYYEQVFQVKVPTDTTIIYNNISADGTVTNFTIDEVRNAPDGLSYSCNPVSCSFTGGSNACITISGTPTQSGTFYMDVDYIVSGEFEVLNLTVNQDVPNTYEDIEVVVHPANSTNQIDPTQLNIYPNPATEQFNIQIGNQISGSAQLKIVNLLGAQVYSSEISAQEMISLNSADFDKGIYFVQVVSNGTEYTQKLIIK